MCPIKEANLTELGNQLMSSTSVNMTIGVMSAKMVTFQSLELQSPGFTFIKCKKGLNKRNNDSKTNHNQRQ